ncbi:hypothetical protein [Prosthecobacter sp.]|uniref:hypothetical protein n=1 Tax=Prosthecobacter sp. TaxID=1965333 RepID=UPI001D4AB0B9|nr:hypothetical protein [Prosthecobacter sp.]MCB1275894.1 hypothetical protein [Prosthecobacter sp.]
MNQPQSRREFLADVGKGTLLATIGPALAAEFGITTHAAAGEATVLNFGDMESLVCFMQETPVSKLQPALAAKLKEGMPLKKLVAAGVLANARNFGGEDYVGFHTLMALHPALKMAASMPDKQAALPVFKVLYRNTNRIQEFGGRGDEVLHPVAAGDDKPSAADLHNAVKDKDTDGAEKIFATMMKNSADDGFNALLECVQDNPEVHRTVLPYRAWDLLDLVGRENATTMLRMALRYCLNSEKYRRPEWDENANALSKLIDEHKLMGRDPGTRSMEDSVMEKLSMTIFSGTPQDAAGAVAAALAEGFDPHEIGEAISLAANQLVLRDHGRPPEWESPGKPPGSVHGDSVGVHASDSVHAWRNLSQVSKGRNVFACLILGAWQVARDRGGNSVQHFLEWESMPSKRQISQTTDQAKLLAELDDNIRQNMQGHAAGVVHRCGIQGIDPEVVFKALLRYAVSEDGALHAEKYFQTTWDEFHRTRPAFRWRQLVSLARVTASEFGRPAPGQAEARELLGV